MTTSRLIGDELVTTAGIAQSSSIMFSGGCGRGINVKGEFIQGIVAPEHKIATDAEKLEQKLTSPETDIQDLLATEQLMYVARESVIAPFIVESRPAPGWA